MSDIDQARVEGYDLGYAEAIENERRLRGQLTPGEQTRRELHSMIETLESVAFDLGYQEGRAAEQRNAETTREAEKRKAVMIEQEIAVQAEDIGLLNRALRSVLGSRLRTTP